MISGIWRKAFVMWLIASSLLLGGCQQDMVILDPKGPIGLHELHLILIAFALMLIVVLPVFILAFWFAWHYRAGNTRARYRPDWSYSLKIDLVIWLVPAVIVMILGYLTWTTSHSLDPYRPLAENGKAGSATKPMTIEVVSFDWKWLFIYPKQHIATVNRLVFPAHTPIHFKLTSATVMTSFFIPQLGGQIYAMPGMQTQLHLLASQTGKYKGLNYQFSGRGFPKMSFKAIATTQDRFHAWVQQVRQMPRSLDNTQLKRLEQPGTQPVMLYASVMPHLFHRMLDRFSGNPSEKHGEMAQKTHHPDT